MWEHGALPKPALWEWWRPSVRGLWDLGRLASCWARENLLVMWMQTVNSCRETACVLCAVFSGLCITRYLESLCGRIHPPLSYMMHRLVLVHPCLSRPVLRELFLWNRQTTCWGFLGSLHNTNTWHKLVDTRCNAFFPWVRAELDNHKVLIAAQWMDGDVQWGQYLSVHSWQRWPVPEAWLPSEVIIQFLGCQRQMSISGKD